MNHLFTVTIPYFTNIPEDVAVNTFHFDWSGGGSPSGAQVLAQRQRIEDFYEDVFDTVPTRAMAPYVQLNTWRYKAYDLSQPTPRVPIMDVVVPTGVARATTSTTPPETAICLSLKAASVPGIPVASTRGRIFLGPLADGCFTLSNASAFPTVSSGFLTNLATSAQTLLTTSAAADWDWNILSPTVGLAFPVTGGFIDNAQDTIRRRGNVASARTLW